MFDNTVACHQIGDIGPSHFWTEIIGRREDWEKYEFSIGFLLFGNLNTLQVQAQTRLRRKFPLSLLFQRFLKIIWR